MSIESELHKIAEQLEKLNGNLHPERIASSFRHVTKILNNLEKADRQFDRELDSNLTTEEWVVREATNERR